MTSYVPLNDATPRMDIYKVKERLYNCSEANVSKHNRALCEKCPYYGTRDCWQRLMLDAAHALTLMLAERDEGKPLIVEGEDDGKEK